MKKIKICAIMSFSLFGITIGSSAVIINSCTTNDQKYFEFINQRTFNIQTITTDHTGHQVGGTLTIWLFKQINSYEYYFFTNFHCLLAMFAHQAESQETTNIYYNFSTSSSTGSALKDENVLLGNANDENIFKWISIPNYYEENDVSYNDDTYDKIWGADLAVGRINFASKTDSDVNLRQKLDLLNNYAQKHDSFLMNFSQEGLVEKDTNFIGGYPGVKDSTQKICYRNAKFKIQNIRQAFYKHPHSGTPDPSVPDNNWNRDVDWNARTIGGINPWKIWYVSMCDAGFSEFVSNGESSPLGFFIGGASGSLVINKKFQAVGIYRGHISDILNPNIAIGDGAQLWIESLACKGFYNLVDDFLNNRNFYSVPNPSDL